jgi:hydrogenase maturation protein HypF
MTETVAVRARRIQVRGVVQGVGFRPSFYQLAVKHHLTGWISNTSGDVTIELEGEKSRLDRFILEMQQAAPPQSHIESITDSEIQVRGYGRFEIRESLIKENEYQLISPDLATCSACREEIFDPVNRRYNYPFTNCTNCGPRFTIIEDIPYDRPLTTMREFKMCEDCRKEYDDPADRRFHAQPDACSVCGPRLELVTPDGCPFSRSAPLKEAARLLKEGKILAIKGLGGFLLACDATNDTSVRQLRERKHRPGKPFAVMLKDLNEVQEVLPGQ